jgi:uncharacterized membrane protein YgdD (TMEM256/DUF423 family)
MYSRLSLTTLSALGFRGKRVSRLGEYIQMDLCGGRPLIQPLHLVTSEFYTQLPCPLRCIRDPAVPLVVLLCTLGVVYTAQSASQSAYLSPTVNTLYLLHAVSHTVSVFVQHESRPANSKSTPAFLGILTTSLSLYMLFLLHHKTVHAEENVVVQYTLQHCSAYVHQSA